MRVEKITTIVCEDQPDQVYLQTNLPLNLHNTEKKVFHLELDHGTSRAYCEKYFPSAEHQFIRNNDKKVVLLK
jgi:hypothetical protein